MDALCAATAVSKNRSGSKRRCAAPGARKLSHGRSRRTRSGPGGPQRCTISAVREGTTRTNNPLMRRFRTDQSYQGGLVLHLQWRP
jgi:hypothetical protein